MKYFQLTKGMLIKVNALPPTIEQNNNNNDLYKIKANNGNN